MTKFSQFLFVVMLSIVSIGCSNSNDGLYYLKGSWQLSGNSLVLTENGVVRTLGFEIYNVDLVRLMANVLENAQSLYPDAGITGAMLSFFLDRRIAI